MMSRIQINFEHVHARIKLRETTSSSQLTHRSSGSSDRHHRPKLTDSNLSRELKNSFS
jgi:REP element-mobilizing transposase RayT